MSALFRYCTLGLFLLSALITLGPANKALGDESEYSGSIPSGAVFESKDGDWKFKDDRLVFLRANPNPDGRRYFEWKDYNWIVSSTDITIIDPRAFGVSFTASRNQVDEDNKLIPEKKIMDNMRDEAKDRRQSNESAAEPVEYDSVYYGPTYYSGTRYYYGPRRYYYEPSFSFGFGIGPRYHHHYHRSHRYHHRR